MSLYGKLVLFILLASTVPLIVVGFVLMGSAEDALRDRIVEAQRQAVSVEAEAVGAFVNDRVEELSRAAGHFDLDEVGPDELQGAVRLLYRSVPEVAIALLVGADGELVAEPAFLSEPERYPDLAGRPLADSTSTDRLLAFLPTERALTEGPGAVILSPVYYASERNDTAMAIALPVLAGERILVYGAEISLRYLQQRLSTLEGLGTVVLIDAEGRFAVHPNTSLLRKAADGPEHHRALAMEDAGHSREPSVDGPVLAAFSPIPLPGLDWRVVASLPEAEAFSPVRRMRWTVLGASASTIVLLLSLGALFMRRVRRGLGAVTLGAEAFSRGDLDHRIDAPPETELAALARTFNAMGEELSAARAHLLRWNETLHEEVEARTKDLKAAQARLLRAQKLAAVGQLGAGVAHEVNNPLAGILGNVQLMLLKKKKAGVKDDDPELSSLRKVEEAAKRCREITTSLLRFSQHGSGARRDRLNVGELIAEAAALFSSQIEGSTVDLEIDLSDGMPELTGDVEQLTQVLLHILSNARTAILEKEDGRILVRAWADEDRVVISVSDDGIGIESSIRDRIFEPFFTTKTVWTSLGLGLSVAYRIVEDHGGAIEVDSEPGEGTEVRVFLPTASDAGLASG